MNTWGGNSWLAARKLRTAATTEPSSLSSKISTPSAPGRPIYVVGPTGVGKSEVALSAASKIRATIVGADAFQIYREIPILTAQPDSEARAHVPHHLVACQSVADPFDVGQYARQAGQLLADLDRSSTPALVVGGTGLYVRALTDGLTETPPPNPQLRAELDALSLATLISRLTAADPEAASITDLKNKRRVTRAIEICELSGRPLSDFRRTPHRPARGIVLTRDRDDLHARIAANVRSMIDRGVLDEVAALQSVGPTAAKTLGLADIQHHLAGTLSLPDCVEILTIRTRQYAKRQLTWFRNQTNFEVLNLTGLKSPAAQVTSALERLLVND